MKVFKRIITVALAGVLALSALTGCSLFKTKATVEGTVTLKENDAVVFADAPFLMVTNGDISYTKYEANGTVNETISDGTYNFSRAYPSGTGGVQWAKSAAAEAGATSKADMKKGTMTIDGKEYTTQTYDEVTYYCLDGKSLAYIYTKSGEGEITIKITNMSEDIDEYESLLVLPADSDVAAAS